MQAADAYSAMFRGEFARAIQEAFPGPLADVTSLANILTATGAWENQNWLTPVSASRELTGPEARKAAIGLLDVQATRVRMKEFGAGFQLQYNQMDDDQMGLWKGKPAELARGAARGMRKEILEAIRLARAVLSFEGVAAQYQAANTHTVGTGDNLLAATTADKTAETLAALYVGGPLKPVTWYDRKKPELITDVGTPESRLAGFAKWFMEYRGAAAFAEWWNFVFVVADGIPTALELQAILSAIETAFRTFQLADGTYIHEQTVFDEKNLVLVASPNLGAVLRTVLQQASFVAAGTATENPWKGFARPVFYNGMDQA